MVHFEFGQDRLTQPHPLNSFELAQGAVKVPLLHSRINSLYRIVDSRAPLKGRNTDPPHHILKTRIGIETLKEWVQFHPDHSS